MFRKFSVCLETHQRKTPYGVSLPHPGSLPKQQQHLFAPHPPTFYRETNAIPKLSHPHSFHLSCPEGSLPPLAAAVVSEPDRALHVKSCALDCDLAEQSNQALRFAEYHVMVWGVFEEKTHKLLAHLSSSPATSDEEGEFCSYFILLEHSWTPRSWNSLWFCVLFGNGFFLYSFQVLIITGLAKCFSNSFSSWAQPKGIKKRYEIKVLLATSYEEQKSNWLLHTYRTI